MERGEYGRLVKAALLGKYPRKVKKDEQSHKTAKAGGVVFHRLDVHLTSLCKKERERTRSATAASSAVTATTTAASSTTSGSSRVRHLGQRIGPAGGFQVKSRAKSMPPGQGSCRL